MPEMTLLGWFHTILGIGALASAFYTLFKYKIISLDNRSGKLYVLVTIIVAGSAVFNEEDLRFPIAELKRAVEKYGNKMDDD